MFRERFGKLSISTDQDYSQLQNLKVTPQISGLCVTGTLRGRSKSEPNEEANIERGHCRLYSLKTQLEGLTFVHSPCSEPRTSRVFAIVDMIMTILFFI
jgi:hypothetical protein